MNYFLALVLLLVGLYLVFLSFWMLGTPNRPPDPPQKPIVNHQRGVTFHLPEGADWRAVVPHLPTETKIHLPANYYDEWPVGELPKP